MKIKTIVESFVDNMMEQMHDYDRNWCLLNVEQIEMSINDDVEIMAENKTQKNWEVEAYPESFERIKSDIFTVLEAKFICKILVSVKDMMEGLGYQIYTGDFFPCNGYFKSLAPEQIAFIK